MSPSKPARARQLLRLLLLGVSLLAGGLAYDIWSYGDAAEDDRSADAAIVLGAAVWGGDPSPRFQQRLDYAIGLYRRGRVGQLLLTGGREEGQRLGAAEVARQYAIGRGVKPAHIHLAARARSSRETLADAARLARQLELRPVVLVTEPLETRRSLLVARSFGLDARPAPTPASAGSDRWAEAVTLARETLYVAEFFAAHYAERLIERWEARGTAAKASL